MSLTKKDYREELSVFVETSTKTESSPDKSDELLNML